MRHKLLITSLLIVTSLTSLGHAPCAKCTQDKKPTGNFSQRPAPPVSAEAKKEMEARLAEARATFAANPNNPDAIIWLGRRLSYLGRFSEAIEVYTKGVERFPDDARLYRHRGHRYITMRRFNLAIADLKTAAKLTSGKPDEIEPDGQPNARNIPTGTLQFNVWYHLGLAYYLTGNNNEALKAYRECLKVSNNADKLVATSHWLYMTLRRLNREQDAAKVLEPIRAELDVIENAGYYRLLLMYRGSIASDSLMAEAKQQGGSAAAHSILYGIGNWHLYNGRRTEALRVFGQILEGEQWTSFGYIAAEADMHRQTGSK